MLRAKLAYVSGMRRARVFFVALCAGLAMSSAAMAAPLHVPAEYPTIQAAVNASAEGDEIIVADGVYVGAGNRDIDLLGKSIVVRSANGAAACTIDCQQSGRAFYIHSGEGHQTVVDGFTIVNGRVTGGATAGGPFGGAIFVSAASPTILNCIFASNAVINDGQKGGGAIYAAESSIRIESCEFHKNFVANDGALELAGNEETGLPVQGGGGVMVYDFSGKATPIVQNCRFIENFTPSSLGGAISIQANTAITDCEFTENTASNGGAMYVAYVDASVQGSLFIENASKTWGGAIYLEQAEADIRNCRFAKNLSLGGGAIECFASDLELRHSTFVGNEGSSGGALRTYEGTSSVFNCAFFGNQCNGNGGAMRVYASISTVVNSTMVHNTAVSGGGISAGEYGQPVLRNCVFWENAATIGPEASIDINARRVILDFNYCNVKGGQNDIFLGHSGALVWGKSNIDLDPKFVLPNGFDDDAETLDDNNYRLHGGSPCIDAGDNAALPLDLLLDIDGNPRFLDDPSTPDSGQGSAGGGGVVDLGAFEFQGVTGDVDGNGAVNIDDLMLIIASWGQCTSLICPSDLTGNGTVDCDDLLMVLNYWS